ncbi:hypothetical protein RND81_01G090500 [Saponaria officinalis]|uniref:Amino acid transporter transmembrane domain-containing protein n=1 Tax=Saponaria officinalis TaxID=3572 RepID=A0AAW1NFK4_SAPOF
MTSQHEMQGNHTEEVQDINDWLPITAARKAKWYYSAFHNVTAMVGAGVLGLPYAMAQLGWYGGISAMLVSWVVTYYSLWQLVELHEAVPGTRFDRYPELGMHAFGPKLGYWIVMPQQTIVQVAINIVYMVTGGKSLKKACDIAFPSLPDTRTTYYTLIFAFLELLLSQAPNFHSLKLISFLAALMSIAYSLIACLASIRKGVSQRRHNQPVEYGVRSNTTAGIIFDTFNGLGTIAFAFAGHSVVLEIQATIPSSLEKPSKKPMWKGAVVAYILVAMCYLSVAVAGYWAFGRTVEDDVLVSLERPPWIISAANFMVFIHVVGSYQVFAMPMYDMIESYLLQKWNCTPGVILRLIARSTYVALTAIVGICVPFFGGLLGFFGGLAFASTSYFLPCIMWLIMHQPKIWSFHWTSCWVHF